MDLEAIWKKTLSAIEGNVGNSTFDLWFKPIKLIKLTDDKAVLSIPNRFFKEWLEDNYPLLINETLENFTSKKVSVNYKVEQRQAPAIKKKDELLESRKQKLAKQGIYLNPKYTFDNFLVGPSNQFAHAAALAVCSAPGKSYNPLFIYGDVGLGKTHLISAIGNRIFDLNQDISVIYVSSEQFTNEVVAAIRHGKMESLKERYRNVDILLLDDVQFIANKIQTQEEFFHTFNALYERQKQIVISSDRPPKEISEITDRLKSRFTMGLIADIQSPSLELKTAILHKKAENEKISIPDDVAFYLASRIRSNIRELEGCLIKLAAHSVLIGSPINLDMAKHILKDVFYDDTKPITVDYIQKVVSTYYGIKVSDIKAKKRTKEVTIPRQAAMYISKKLTDLSLSDIGNSFGGKDHATVIYACKQIESRLESDESFGRIIDQLINKIKT